jgi:organic hydroperoxide reductase OsmC/OhrA
VTPVHDYRVRVRWTGDLGEGTRDYRGYSRDYAIEVDGKPTVLGSSGMSPRSDPTRHNPDELLVAALSSCHMLWYLHLCSQAGVVVTGYSDQAVGQLEIERGGAGRFTEATLHPRVVIRSGDLETARRLHEEAHRKCFIANSVNFPVRYEPEFVREPDRAA